MVPHPYYAVTDESGRFELTDVPPGQYEIVAWHEVLEAARRGSEEAGVECLEVTPGEFERLLNEADPVPAVVQR